MLALVEAAGLRLRAARLEGDLERVRAHLSDGDPAVRKHAKDWCRQLEAERLVIARWRSEIAAPAMLCSGEGWS